MLPSAFIDWWFAPWSYATGLAHLPTASDVLGRRDGYRSWCAAARVDPDMPPRFDPAWHIVAAVDGAELTAAARLFAGLLAAREHDRAALGGLSFADHKWCVSVAATQPLLRCSQVHDGADEPIEVRGLVELADRLELGFPGLWTRLRLTLPLDTANRIERLRQDAPASAGKSDAGVMRAQRCWRLCRDRIESIRVKRDGNA
jgi:hypothetical protein